MPITYKPTIGALSDVPNGAWHSDTTQVSTQTNHEYLMTFSTIEFERGIQLQDSSKLRVSNTGLYNLAFSAQLYNSDGGGNSAALEIWLKKNGTSLDHTGTRVSVIANHPYTVAAWNFYVSLANNDYVELAWAVNTAGINILSNTSFSPGPTIPSIIATMTQVG